MYSSVAPAANTGLTYPEPIPGSQNTTLQAAQGPPSDHDSLRSYSFLGSTECVISRSLVVVYIQASTQSESIFKTTAKLEVMTHVRNQLMSCPIRSKD